MASAPGLETRLAWSAWCRGFSHPESGPANNQVTLPSSLRRRISAIGQRAFRASWTLSEQRDARFVFCSRYGEMDRTLRILHSLSAAEPVSPADFSLSVHNALAGLLSIAWRNTEGHTAISAGDESFGYGLLEAGACLTRRTDEAVMLVYFDDVLAPPYDEFAGGTEPCVALAMLLKPSRNGSGDFILTLEPGEGVASISPSISQPLAFLKFMAAGEPALTWAGDRKLWRWRRCD